MLVRVVCFIAFRWIHRAQGLILFFSSRRRHTRFDCDWSSDVCSSDLLAIGAAAAVMRRQKTGGSIIASVSKAALAPGPEAVAYGGSKAALLQALRVAAVELGGDGIRVNAINADQIETPMFRRFVEERAARSGVSAEAQLEAYRRRNVMGASLIPAEVVADIAVLLASERFRFTTGDILDRKSVV